MFRRARCSECGFRFGFVRSDVGRYAIHSFLILVALFATTITVRATAESRSFTVEGVLQREGFGAAFVDATDRWLFYEKLRPYSEAQEYSFGSQAFTRVGHQVWRLNLAEGSVAELLPGLDQTPSTYLHSISADGRFLALLNFSEGEFGLVLYDNLKRRSRDVSLAPAFSWTGEYEPVWVSSHELVYAALPPGEQPLLTSARSFTGRALFRSWQDAWKGEKPTASEIRSAQERSVQAREAGRLVRVDARTGNTFDLAQGLYADLRLSPDKALLAGFVVSKRMANALYTSANVSTQMFTLVAIDLSSNAVFDLASQLEFVPYTLSWSADSQTIVAFGWEEWERPEDGRFYQVDLRAGTVVAYDHSGLDLASERERGGYPRPERAFKIGEELIVYARTIPPELDQAPRFSLKDVGQSGLSDAHWYAISPDGSKRRMTGGLQNVSAVPLHADGHGFSVLADDGVYRVDVSGARTRLTPEITGELRHAPLQSFSVPAQLARREFNDVITLLEVTQEDSRAILLDLSKRNSAEMKVVNLPTQHPTVLVGSLKSGSLFLLSNDGFATHAHLARANKPGIMQLVSSANEHLADVEMGNWVSVKYDASAPNSSMRTHQLESCVLLPPNFDAATPPRLVVEVYPNARSHCSLAEQGLAAMGPRSPYLWAAMGFAYTRLPAPSELIRSEEGPITELDEVINVGVDALVKAGLVDDESAILVGFSQGGISALYVAAETDRFSKVIAMNSWADMFSHYFGPTGINSLLYKAQFGNFWRYETTSGSDFGVGDTPFRNPEIFVRNSPVFLAPKISAKVLLISSDMDTFDRSQFDEMFGALSRAGKDVRYVRYWGEGHGVSSPANIRDFWWRAEEFLSEEPSH